MTARKTRVAPSATKPIAVAPKQPTATKAARAPRTRSRLAIGKRPVSAYDAATNHPLIPRVQDISHSNAARSQRPMQLLSRQMYRNETWIRQLIEVKAKIDVGVGPVPTSRFPELDELWAAASEEFDNTGHRSWGAWLRNDVYRNFLLDGEIFVRERNRDGYEIVDMLIIRTQWQVIPSHFVPHGFTRTMRETVEYGREIYVERIVRLARYGSVRIMALETLCEELIAGLVSRHYEAAAA